MSPPRWLGEPVLAPDLHEDPARTRRYTPRVRTSTLLSLAGILLASSCSSLDFIEVPEAKDWNLRQLHAEDGSHNLRAATMGDTAYLLRAGLGGMLSDPQGRLEAKSASRQKHVPDQVLENFMALSKFSTKKPRIAVMQVKWATWLAVADPWPLVRERAVIELGRLTKGMELKSIPGLLPSDELSSNEETQVALTQLIRAAKSSVYELRAPDETEELDIQAACDLVRELNLTVETGYKALEVVELLLDKGNSGSEFREPIETLARDLTQDLAGQALVRAVRDPVPIVRAAAIGTLVEVTGTDILRLLIENMTREPSPLVLTRLLRLIRVHGLPDLPSELSPEAGTRVQDVWIDVIYSFATAHHDGLVRVNAMQALQAAVGGPESLRSEDWQRWWYGRRAESSNV